MVDRISGRKSSRTRVPNRKYLADDEEAESPAKHSPSNKPAVSPRSTPKPPEKFSGQIKTSAQAIRAILACSPNKRSARYQQQVLGIERIPNEPEPPKTRKNTVRNILAAEEAAASSKKHKAKKEVILSLEERTLPDESCVQNVSSESESHESSEEGTDAEALLAEMEATVAEGELAAEFICEADSIPVSSMSEVVLGEGTSNQMLEEYSVEMDGLSNNEVIEKPAANLEFNTEAEEKISMDQPEDETTHQEASALLNEPLVAPLSANRPPGRVVATLSNPAVADDAYKMPKISMQQAGQKQFCLIPDSIWSKQLPKTFSCTRCRGSFFSLAAISKHSKIDCPNAARMKRKFHISNSPVRRSTETSSNNAPGADNRTHVVDDGTDEDDEHNDENEFHETEDFEESDEADFDPMKEKMGGKTTDKGKKKVIVQTVTSSEKRVLEKKAIVEGTGEDGLQDTSQAESMDTSVLSSQADSECVESLMELSSAGAQEAESQSGPVVCACGRILLDALSMQRHRDFACPLTVDASLDNIAGYFLCEVCNKGFTNKSNLVRHMKKFGHREGKLNPDGPQCQFCLKKYANLKVLKLHQKIFCGKLLKCPICQVLREKMKCSVLVHVTGHVNRFFTGTTDSEGREEILRLQNTDGELLTTFLSLDQIDDDMATRIAQGILQEKGFVEQGTYCVDVQQVQNAENEVIHESQHDNDDLQSKTILLKPAISYAKSKGENKPYKCDRCHGSFMTETTLKNHQLLMCCGFCECQCPICKVTCNSIVALYKHVKEHIYLCLSEDAEGSSGLMLLSATTGGSLVDEIRDNRPKSRLDESKMRSIFRQITEVDPGTLGDLPCFSIDLWKKAWNKGVYDAGDDLGPDAEGKTRPKDGRGYTKVEWLRQMVRLSDGRRQCKECEAIFANEEGFKSHFLHEHATKCFVCEICAKPFPHERSLKSHFKSHSEDRPFSCDICQKRFKHKCTLQQHIREHLGTTNCMCDICGMQFKRKYNLKMHKEGSHFNFKPFHCPFCPAKFGKKSHWTTHKKIHEEGRTNRRRVKELAEIVYPCDYCEKVLMTAEGRKTHMTVHTGGGVPCPACERKYTTHAAMRRHLWDQHGIEYEDEIPVTRKLGRPRKRRKQDSESDAVDIEDIDDEREDGEEIVLEELVLDDEHVIQIQEYAQQYAQVHQ